MSDINNGPEGDSNSGPILAPGVYLSPTRIMALPQAIPESERNKANIKYHVTTIKRASDALAANRSLLTPLCPTTNDLRGFASPVKNGCLKISDF